MNILIDNDLNVNVSWDINTVINKKMVIGDSYTDMGFPGMTENGSADNKSSGTSPLSSWPFVIGISGAMFAISVVIGILLAKRRIKKGIDAYED